jgi:ribosome biogenesis protein NSA2
MPQNNYIDKEIKNKGRAYDHHERQRKKEVRLNKKISKKARKLRGIKAKLFQKKRYKTKTDVKKAIKAHEEKLAKNKAKPSGNSKAEEKVAIPAYLLDREDTNT